MSVRDEGGFDLVMEVAQQLLLEVATQVSIPQSPTNLSFAGISGTLTPAATVDGIVLGTAPQIIISISLTGSTFSATSVPIYLSPVPDSLRNIDLVGDVSVPVPLAVSGLALAADFANAGTPTVSQEVFDSILGAPLIQFLLVETLLVDPTGALYNSTVQTIETAFTTQVQQLITGLPDATLIDFSGFSSSLATSIGTGLSALNFSFGNQSIFLLFTVGGSPGNPTLITRSDLLRNSENQPADRADLIVSNACLLRDFIRPKLVAPPGPGFTGGLGLTPGGFLPGFGGFAPIGIPAGSPIEWFGSVPFAAIVGGPIASASITSVIVGDDGTNLRLLIGGTATGILGTFTATTSIDITISVALTITGTTLSLTLTPLGSPVVNTNVSIPWWVYVVGFAIGGFEVAAIIAAANAFGGSIANGIISGSLAGLGGFTFTAPLPSNTPPITVRAMSMGQSDAPPQFLSGPFFPLLDPFPQNDIVANFI